MPRARKTMSGEPAQKVAPITGQTYGDAKQQEMLQETMPAPKVGAAQIAATSGEAPAPNEPQAPRPPVDIAAAIRGVGGLLSQPDDRPTTPVTDGLSSGPGRGPEALTRNTQMGNTLRRLALQTNDPIFYELASKIGL